MKRKLLILLAVLLVAAFVLTPRIGRADLGDFSGDGDFGGGDSCGDSCAFDLIYVLLRLGCAAGECAVESGACTGGQVFLFGVIVVIAVLVLLFVLSRRVGQNKDKVKEKLDRMMRGAGPVSPGATVASRIRAVDPHFSEEDLKEKLKNLYFRFTDCCEKRDLEPLRPYLSDALFAQTQQTLDALGKLHVTERQERLAILDAALLGFTQRDGADQIRAKLSVRSVTYRQNDDTGEIVSGSREAECFSDVMLTLSRPTGVMTRPRETGTIVRHCPRCGAPLSLNESNLCPYCDSILPKEEDEWVILSIERR